MRYVLNRMKNQFSDYFLSYRENSSKIMAILVQKIIKDEHNSKNKNRKNLKFGFSFYSTDSRSFMYILKKKKMEFDLDLIGHPGFCSKSNFFLF